MSIPQFQTALVVQGPGKLAVVHDVAVPALEADMVLVKTAAVAINPADAKMLDFSAVPGAVHGYDFSGTVVALGDDAKAEGKLQIGDRVAGLVHGMNVNKPGVGSFAQYVGAYHDLLLKIPDSMSFEDAASFGTGLSTASLSLFHEMRVPATLEQLSAGVPSKTGEFVLVAGGSTATGTRAIQLLKLAGLRPIATCSPSNNDLVTSFGAEKVFNYGSPTCAADIRAYTEGELNYALDCVSSAETTQLCYGAIGRAGGRYVALEPFRDAVAQTRSLTVVPSWVMVLTIFGHKVDLDGEYGREARPEDRAFGRDAFAAVQTLLDRGLITTHPVKPLPGGWEGVMQGVDTIRTQALSGYKLVYGVA